MFLISISGRFTLLQGNWSKSADSEDDVTEKDDSEESYLFLRTRKLAIRGKLKIIISIRVNWRIKEEIIDYIMDIFGSEMEENKWEVARSNGDLWFLLSGDVEELNMINIFSSEKQTIPEAVLRHLDKNRARQSVKFRYAGSSIK